MTKFHIFFDIDGVLLETPSPEKITWDNESKNLGIDLNLIMQEFFAHHFKNVLLGKTSLFTTLDNVIKAHSYDINIKKIINSWFKKELIIDHKVFYYLKLLLKHPQVTLYVASNQSMERADFLLHRLKLTSIFTKMFFSSEIGMLKVTPKFFKKVQKSINVKKDSLLILFDDDINNINSAKKAGWDAYLYENVSLFLENTLIKKLLNELMESNYERI